MKKELELLREAMSEHGLDLYLITMDDDHQSEYVGDYYKEIRFISGFTGSAGKLLVSMEGAWLWTDGRYFVQAEAELSGNGIELMRMGQAGTPLLSEHAGSIIPEGGRLGFNGRTVSYTEARELSDKLTKKQANIVTDLDLPNLYWKDRPKKSCTLCRILPDSCTGEPSSSKLLRLREEMKNLGAEAHIISSLDDIAWLLNMRADDVRYNPVFLSFFMIDGDRMSLYMDPGHLSDEVRTYLGELHIDIKDEDGIYEDIRKLSSDSLLLDTSRINAAIGAAIPKHIALIDRMLPTTAFKAVKNRTEMDNLRNAHIRDGLALTRFMHWFKKHVGSGELTECSCAERLHEFRMENEGFMGESFETISAYGSNAAMCHYSPSQDHDRRISPKGLYLVDSGGQYTDGTTDVTRTFCCGPLSYMERLSYTLTVIGCLRLSDAVFPEGTGGAVLDQIARAPFWQRHLDYDHGTGHGVGYMLNVHEGPASIRFRSAVSAKSDYGLREGIFISDEPGHYVEGNHGARTENLLMCVKDMSDPTESFCRFDIYTLCPIDKEGIDKSLMDEEDMALLDDYHKKVFDELSPYLEGEELAWLQEACSPL